MFLSATHLLDLSARAAGREPKGDHERRLPCRDLLDRLWMFVIVGVWPGFVSLEALSPWVGF